MKRKKLCLIAFCIALTVQISAQHTTFQERTENWLKSTSADGAPTTDDDTMTETPGVQDNVPISDAFPFLLGLSMAYGLYLWKRRENVNKV
jgi:hypothetical protein